MKRIAFALACVAPLLLAWSYTYDTTTPAGTDRVPVLDDRIREVKSAVQERENIDHVWPLSGTQVSDADTGKHRRVLFYDVLSSAPTVATDEGCLYPYAASGITELYWKDESANVKQLTSAGKLNLVLTDIADDLITEAKIRLSTNGWLAGTNTAGDGEINLIETDGVSPVLGSGAKTYSTAAPVHDQHVSNKKYVDDQVDTKNFGAKTTLDTDGVALTKDEVYLAQSDGFVSAYRTGIDNNVTVTLYVDTVNPPTTIVQQVTSTVEDALSVFAAVPSGSYVKLTSSTSGITRVDWTPMGTGGLVNQP